MKKIFLLLTFPTLLSVSANAQDSSESRKPEAGDVTTEVNLGLFNTGVTLTNVVNQLRGRYFLSPTTAIRLGFNATVNSGKTEDDFQNSNGYKRTLKSSSFSFSPGIEKHFTGTDRLSPYIGAEISFVAFNYNEEQNRDNGTPKKIEYVNSWSHGQRSYTLTSLNAVAGVDYYFAKHFYAGIELGYGFGFSKQKEVELLRDGVSVSTVDGNTGFSLGAYANNGIRIGFVF